MSSNVHLSPVAWIIEDDNANNMLLPLFAPNCLCGADYLSLSLPTL